MDAGAAPARSARCEEVTLDPRSPTVAPGKSATCTVDLDEDARGADNLIGFSVYSENFEACRLAALASRDSSSGCVTRTTIRCCYRTWRSTGR